LALGCFGVACGDDSTPGSTTFSATTGTPPGTTATPTTETTGLDDTGTSEDGSSDDAAEPQCPPTHECVPAPPEGWEGPVALLESPVAEDEEGPECGGSHPDASMVGYRDLVAPPAECSCACGPAVDVSCSLSVTVRFWGSDPTCSETIPAQYQFYSTTCNMLPSAVPANSHWTVLPGAILGGSCDPTPTEQIEPARFTKRVAGCTSNADVQSCGETGICSPRPDDTFMDRLCVWRSGRASCPSEFPEDIELFTQVADERACAECACEDPVGLCDAGTVTLFNQPCNPPIAGVLTANGHCQSSSWQTVSASYGPGEPSAFCVPSEPMSIGVAVPEEPLTVCCR
jgi:hypothetical protein